MLRPGTRWSGRHLIVFVEAGGGPRATLAHRKRASSGEGGRKVRSVRDRVRPCEHRGVCATIFGSVPAARASSIFRDGWSLPRLSGRCEAARGRTGNLFAVEPDAPGGEIG